MDLFETSDAWVATWIRENAEHEVSIETEYEQVESALKGIVDKAASIDPTLRKKVEADMTRMMKDVEHLGKRLVRAEKSQNETRIGQIRKLHDRLFPAGNLQERHDNFMAQYLRLGRPYLDMLIGQLDPFVNKVLIIEEEEVDSGGTK